jgi:signal peptidase I
LIGLIALFVIISPVKIEGGSMENTLENGQLVATYRFAPSSYSVGDVVTIKVGDKIIIKRIVAKEGDSIAFVREDDGGVYLYKVVDGEWKKVNESYLKEKPVYKSELFKDVTIYDSPSEITVAIVIEKGKVYALGDNRNVSVDSRTYGQFKTGDIISKMAFNISENGFMNFIFTVLFPFSKGETHND